MHKVLRCVPHDYRDSALTGDSVKNWPATMRETTIAGLVLLFLTSACAKHETASPGAAQDPAAPSAAANASGFDLQPAHGDDSGGGATGANGAIGATAAGGLTFDLPAAWNRQTPTSSMRMAQAKVPGTGGAGELAVFYFGPGQGGGVENNFERWLGQVQSDNAAKPERGELAAGGFRISWIDAHGTLLPSGMGSGPSSPQPGSRLLGAVIEGPGGPWFVKATGPEATLAAARADFLALLATARAAPRP